MAKNKIVLVIIIISLLLGIFYLYFIPFFQFSAYTSKFDGEIYHFFSRVIKDTGNSYGYNFSSDSIPHSISLMRESLEKSYSEKRGQENLTNIYEIIYLSLPTNTLEYVYSISRFRINENSLEPFSSSFIQDLISIHEKHGTVALTSLGLATSGVKSTATLVFIRDSFESCENSTMWGSFSSCYINFMEEIKNFAEVKKNSIGEYNEVALPDCAMTFIYKETKRIEKEQRASLIKIEEPYSIINKAIEITAYEKCSEELYSKYIKNKSCPFITFFKKDDIDIVEDYAGLFIICVTKDVKNSLDEFDRYLNEKGYG